MVESSSIYRWTRCGENIHFLNTEYEDYSSNKWKIGFYFSTNEGHFVGPFEDLQEATEAYEVHLHLSEAVFV